MTEQTNPPGYRRDPQGRLVPESMIKPVDKMRDELVLCLTTLAKYHGERLASFKQSAFTEIESFMYLSAAEYGATLGGKKGNITLTSFDGRFKIVRQVQDTITFDERLQVAKQLIDSCVVRWANGARAELRALVLDAFQVDKEGRLNTARILGLKRLDIDDEEWGRAMQAINDSMRATSSTTYVRFYERVGESDRYEAISLDLAVL